MDGKERTQCAYCGKSVIIQHRSVMRLGKINHYRKVVNGVIITDGTQSGGTPVCKEHYAKIVYILSHGGLYFRNPKGQIQKV